MLLFLALLGVGAGVLTTIAGLGGGMTLILTLSLTMSPTRALIVTAPALFLGNLHRLWVHRARVDRRLALVFAGGALPGSVVGGLLLTAIPVVVMRGLFAGTTAFAVARALGALRRPIHLPALMLWPAGFGIGATAATSGGAGLLISPLLMFNGLTGEAYVATSAAIAVAMHAGRLAAYGAGGLMTTAAAATAALLAVAIMFGNLLGDRVRRFITPGAAIRIESGVLLACVLLVLAGFRA